MNNKDFFQSKTTWGAIVLLMVPVLKMFDIEIADQQVLVDGIMALIGAGVVIWGQFTRSTKINSVAGIKVKS